ncbi:hypothetical protein Tco_1565711, partial [Tanacetum coccineum]
LEPVVAPPGIRRRPAIIVRPGEAIPFGRLHRTHLNGPRKLLTAKKRVRPILARRLAWRRVSHHSSDCHSSPDSFVHRSLTRTLRRSDAFRRWRSAPLSTPYPPTTSESSLGLSSERSLDSSSLSSGPSRKRCRSPTASRDLYSPEDRGEEHMEVDTADAEAVAYDDEEFEAEASAADTREIVLDPLAIGDSSESSRGGIPDLEDTIYDRVHYMSEVRIDRILRLRPLRDS